jgi:uncharacterized protein (DUF2141 family)
MHIALLSRRASALLALATVLVAIGVGAVAHAAPATQRHYPPEVRRAFVSSCTRAAKAAAGTRLTTTQAGTYCRSALACIERRLTLRQFERTVQNMQAGRRNPNARVFTSCERAAAKKVTGG